MSLKKEFIKKRVHSISGLFLLLFLIEHLFTNSEAAFWLGDSGVHFIRAVDAIHQLPYLKMLEFFFIFLPFLVHGLFGLASLLQAKMNSGSSDGSTPSLPYSGNQLFTWQRLTAILLVAGVGLHVFEMRFFRYPAETGSGFQAVYSTQLSAVNEYEQRLLEQLGCLVVRSDNASALLEPESASKNVQEAIQAFPIQRSGVLVVSDSFGAITLCVMRELFRSWVSSILYTLFVVLAVFHASNGLVSAATTWGLAVTARARMWILCISWSLGCFLLLCGLSAIWSVSRGGV